jgi:predicted phosphodiesterase
VCYGHDHQAHDEQVGACRLINPGELMGRFGRSLFVLFDTASGKAKSVEVQAR